MPPQMKDMTTADDRTPIVDTTAMDLKTPLVAVTADPASPPRRSSVSSVGSDTRRSMGTKRPSLVFDVDDLELDMALQDEAPAIIQEMNENHQDVLVALSMAFGDHPRCLKETDSAVLTGIDRDGFLLDVTLKTQNGNKEMAAILKDVRVRYQGPVKTVEDMHKEQESLPRLAFDKLGYSYKFENGYYIKVVRKSLASTYEVAKTSPKAVKDGLMFSYEAALADPIKVSAVVIGFVAVFGGIAMGVRAIKNHK